MVDQQLNGGKFAKLTDADWELILPFLEENQKLFGITVEQLLTVNGKTAQAARRSIARLFPAASRPSSWRTPTMSWREEVAEAELAVK